MEEKTALRRINIQKVGTLSLGVLIAFLLTIKGTAFFSTAEGILVACAIVGCWKLKMSVDLPNKLTLLAFALFAGALLLSAVLHGEWQGVVSSFDFIHLMINFFLFYIGTRLFGSEKIFYKAIAMGAFISAGMCLYVVPWGQIMLPNYRFITWGQPNVVAQLLVMPLPFIAVAVYQLRENKFWAIPGFLSLLIVLLAALLTKSRGGMAGLLAGVFIVGLLYWPLVRSKWSTRKKILASAIIVFVASLLPLLIAANAVPRSYDMARVQMLQLAVEMIKDHPWLGVGFDNWFRELPAYVHHVNLKSAPVDWVHAHNDLFQFLATTGVVGASGYIFFSLAIWFLLLRHLARNPREVLVWVMVCVMISFYVHSLVDVCMFQRQVVRMFFGMLGLVLAVADMRGKGAGER